MSLVSAFKYAIDSYKINLQEDLKLREYINNLVFVNKSLVKLAVSLDSKHIYPEFTVNKVPVNSLDELIELEENLYNKVVEIGNRALEANDIQVVSCISDILNNFDHYFCTLNESNNKGEVSS